MVRNQVFSTYIATSPSTLSLSVAFKNSAPTIRKAFPGDPNGHPDEDWEVFYGRVQLLLLDENGDGFRVDQNMTYKLRLDPNDGTWKIVRWIDDPLGGADCAEASEAGKRLANALSWAALKQKVAP